MGKRSGPQIEIQIVEERPESVRRPADEPGLRSSSAVVFLLQSVEAGLAGPGNYDGDEIVAKGESQSPESTDR